MTSHAPATRGRPEYTRGVIVPCSSTCDGAQDVEATLAYKKAAKMAPKPTRLPEAIWRAEAAPVEAGAPVPEAAEPVGREPEPEAPEPEAPAPLPEAGVERTSSTVVLLLALTTTVRVWLKAEPVPWRTRVVMPVPTAGMLAGAG